MERHCGYLLVLRGGRFVGVLCLIQGDIESSERGLWGLSGVYRYLQKRLINRPPAIARADSMARQSKIDNDVGEHV